MRKKREYEIEREWERDIGRKQERMREKESMKWKEWEREGEIGRERERMNKKRV